MVSGLAESSFYSVGFGISLEALGLVVDGSLVLVGCCWLGGCSVWLLLAWWLWNLAAVKFGGILFGSFWHDWVGMIV